MQPDTAAHTSRPPFRRVYLMRHGDVNYFEPGKVPLHPDEVTLNDTGLQQAQAAADILAEVPFDRVVTSHLRRTQQTARIVLGQRDLPLEILPELGEIQPGSLLALTPDNAHDLLTRAFVDHVTPDAQFLGGETYGHFLERVLPAFNALLGTNDWRHLLIVAHGGVNRAILTHLLGSGLAGFGAIEQDPACVNLIDLLPAGQRLVRLLNFTPYNPAKQGQSLTTMEILYEELCRFWTAL